MKQEAEVREIIYFKSMTDIKMKTIEENLFEPNVSENQGDRER